MVDKKSIVMEFLKHNILLSPEELETINEQNYMEFLNKHLNKKTKKQTPNKIEIVVNNKQRETMDVNEFIEEKINNYNTLKEIILKKINAVSIDKAKKLPSSTIIGRVAEITNNGFVIEDVTGSVPVITNDDDIEKGDVLGVSGFTRDGIFFAKKIIWPDIPLTEVGKRTGDITIHLLDKKEPEISIQDIRKKITADFAELLVRAGDEEIKAVALKTNADKEKVINFLKKRTIKINDMKTTLIKEIPNFIWLFNRTDEWSANYKGVVVISTAPGTHAIYKTKKGEVLFEKI